MNAKKKVKIKLLKSVSDSTTFLFFDISNTGERVGSRSIFDELRGVWKCDETLSRVFDISSQSKLKLWRKQRNKSIKIYANIRSALTVLFSIILTG